MRRYVTWLMISLVILSFALAGCSYGSKPVSLPDKPLRSGKEMTHVLYEYFADRYNLPCHFSIDTTKDENRDASAGEVARKKMVP